jgi:hypothetical protein
MATNALDKKEREFIKDKEIQNINQNIQNNTKKVLIIHLF